MAALAAVGEEISAAGCSLLLIVVSPAIVGSILARHGTPDQKDTLAAGDRRRAPRRSRSRSPSPGAGSNSHNLATAARRSNGGYVIRGEKTYISAVEDSDAILVVDPRSATRTGNLGLPLLFIVDSDAPGLRETAHPDRAARRRQAVDAATSTTSRFPPSG